MKIARFGGIFRANWRGESRHPATDKRLSGLIEKSLLCAVRIDPKLEVLTITANGWAGER
jgi:hypothetical protein